MVHERKQEPLVTAQGLPVTHTEMLQLMASTPVAALMGSGENAVHIYWSLLAVKMKLFIFVFCMFKSLRIFIFQLTVYTTPK